MTEGEAKRLAHLQKAQKGHRDLLDNLHRQRDTIDRLIEEKLETLAMIGRDILKVERGDFNR